MLSPTLPQSSQLQPKTHRPTPKGWPIKPAMWSTLQKVGEEEFQRSSANAASKNAEKIASAAAQREQQQAAAVAAEAQQKQTTATQKTSSSSASKKEPAASQQPAAAPAQPRAQTGFTVKALYDYTAADKDEVSFKENDIIVNCAKVDEGWMTGTVQVCISDRDTKSEDNIRLVFLIFKNDGSSSPYAICEFSNISQNDFSVPWP
uniref:SH3 domain-containing protein n=1 Tax=Ditylenchus dipsaci TaxID=166011 RepID=A0A915EVL2_9BILA